MTPLVMFPSAADEVGPRRPEGASCAPLPKTGRVSAFGGWRVPMRIDS